MVMVNKFTNIKERVMQIAKKVAKKQSMSQEAFFESIGMTSASFRGKALHTELKSQAIVNIITKYPEVDIYWLLLGEQKSSLEIEIHDPGETYGREPLTQDQKDEMIALLKSQIEELKSDKEDLRALLQLARKK